MKLICILTLLILQGISCHHKTIARGSSSNSLMASQKGEAILLGIHNETDLHQLPFKEWFERNYTEYRIDSNTADQLRPLLKGKKIVIFMGTWCGDSQREVPRMLKLMTYAGVIPDMITMVMLDYRDSIYKQSPTHEERGKNIHRVPDLIVYNGNSELNRIVEHPIISIEKDLLSILKGESYLPAYRGAGYLIQLFESSPFQEIVNSKDLIARQIKNKVESKSELNALGRVWAATGEFAKAMFAFQLNEVLFPNDAIVNKNLADLNMKLNNNEEALRYYKKLLKIQPGDKHASMMIRQLSK